MAKKEQVNEPATSAATPVATRRVRFIGETASAFSAYIRSSLPAHAKTGDEFEVDFDRAVRLARYYPDRYELVAAPPVGSETPAAQAIQED